MPLGSRNGRRAAGGASPWQPIEDAALGIVKALQDPEAMEGMKAAATAHLAVVALGKAMKQVAANTTQAVAIDLRVRAYFETLGDYVLKAGPSTEEVGQAVIRAHEERIRRIEEGTAQEEKWDIRANSGYGTGRSGTTGRRRGA